MYVSIFSMLRYRSMSGQARELLFEAACESQRMPVRVLRGGASLQSSQAYLQGPLSYHKVTRSFVQ